jgi:hypothetical protein
MENAWRRYQQFVPQYATREQCWTSHEICIVVQTHRFLADARRGPIQAFAAYGPPLIAIGVRPDQPQDPPRVLIDRGMRELQDGGRTPIASVGFFVPTPEQMLARYAEAYLRPPVAVRRPGQANRRGSAAEAKPDNSLTPVESYPVPAARLRNMRRTRER